MNHLENELKEIKREYLLNDYAYDYGHLNSVGSEKVAFNLLIYLKKLLQE